jgi:ribose 5-phosphate isomerase B
VLKVRIAIACDHVGFPLKSSLLEALEQDEHAVLDVGVHSTDPADYPPLARAVATAINKKFVDLGIVACASSVGASMAANRFAGIRAIACEDPAGARQGRERLDVNLVCLGAADVDSEGAVAIVRAWVGAAFLGEERDVRAIARIAELEKPRVAGARPLAPAVAAPAPAATPVAAMESPRVSDISAVMKLVAGVKDDDTKLTATRLLQFLRNRFPSATATVTDDGFTFDLDDQHVATVKLGRNFLELAAGPDRIPTSKIRDADQLEMMLKLPSVSKAFDALTA